MNKIKCPFCNSMNTLKEKWKRSEWPEIPQVLSKRCVSCRRFFWYRHFNGEVELVDYIR